VPHHKLVERVVARLAGAEEEARLEHRQADTGWQGVKVLDLELSHALTRVLQGGLVDVSILTLWVCGCVCGGVIKWDCCNCDVKTQGEGR